VKYLLDTNVIFETAKQKPDQNVLDWLARVPIAEISISSVSCGEILKGIALLKTSRRKTGLHEWYENIRQSYNGRIIAPDEFIFACWAEQFAELIKRGQPPQLFDALLAATALTRGMTLVTRNVSDFENFDIVLENPFT
jgi:toxin FitB